MPFTPYHFGPTGLFGIIFKKWINIPAILLVNVFVDIEPLTVIVFNIRKYPEHGFFHSLGGATVAAVVCVFFVCFLRGMFKAITDFFRIEQPWSMAAIGISALLGAWSHVFMDSFLYTDIMPLFPLSFNPVYGKVTPAEMRLFCTACAAAAIILYVIFISLKIFRRKS